MALIRKIFRFKSIILINYLCFFYRDDRGRLKHEQCYQKPKPGSWRSVLNRKRRTNGVLFWDSTDLNPDTKIHCIKRDKPIKRPIEHDPQKNLNVEQEFKLIARKGRPELPIYSGICHLCQSNKVLIRIGRSPDGDFKDPKTKAKTLGRIYRYLDYDMKKDIGQLGMVSNNM